MRLLLATLVSAVALADGTPAWRAVPKTRFVFGCADESPTAGRAPAPTTVPALWVTPTRITTEQYQQCVERGGCKPVPTKPWCAQQPTWPAPCVSFPEAERYCRWVGARLPTAVEWESLADSGFELNAGEGVDGTHGAVEWVVGDGRKAGYEEVRGGVEDLEPLHRCAWGNARRSLESNWLGFRCVRSTVPPPFPQSLAERQERTLRGFTLGSGQVVLDARLSDDELAHTFAVCRGRVLPLGAYVGALTEQTEWGPATSHAYTAPCRDVVFVITAAEVRAGPFRALGPGRRFGAAKFEGCRVTRGGRVVEVSGPECTLRLAGDLNGDDVADFFVESREVCTSGTLLLSAGDSWLVAARGDLRCPD